MGSMGCHETSVRNYHYSLRNVAGGRSSHLRRGGSLWNHEIRYNAYSLNGVETERTI